MGTQSLVAVIGFLITFGVVNTTMNTRNNLASDNTYGYVKYSAARDIARSSIQVALRKIDTTKTIPANLSVSGSLDEGRYTVTGWGISGRFGADDTIRLHASGKFNDSAYIIRATLLRKDTIFPRWDIKSALGIYPSNPGFSASSSNAKINGADHDSSGIPIVANPDTIAGIAARTLSDVNAIQTSIQRNSSFTMNSVIGNPRIEADPSIPDPRTFARLYESIADTVIKASSNNVNIAQGNSPSGRFGSASRPIVAYLDGNGTTRFQFHGDGWGILVVNGSFSMMSGSAWRGLVIVFGEERTRQGIKETQVDFEAATGVSNVIGAVLVGGASGSGYNISGNANILYSKSALQLAKKAQKAGIYTVLDWYE